MAKRTKQFDDRYAAERQEALRAHWLALGFLEEGRYWRWCKRHGFRTDKSKSADHLHREIRFHKQSLAMMRLTSHRANRNPISIIERFCADQIAPEDIACPNLAEICQRISAASLSEDQRISFGRFLSLIDESSKFVVAAETLYGQRALYIDALLALFSHRHKWHRRPEDWKPTTHNRWRQFTSLVRHLATHYPVPAFMYSVWFLRDRNAREYQRWYIHIGCGGSLKSAHAPLRLTRQMAHHFLRAPDHYTLIQAIRWGQIHALGGGARLSDAVTATRIGRSLDHNDFWLSVLRFFVANPVLDPAQIGPIVDYLYNQKFESEEIYLDGGAIERVAPPHPNLTMRGRTVNSLLRQMEAWHRRLGKMPAGKDIQWSPTDIKGFCWSTGKDDRRKKWRIHELLGHKQLAQEGNVMKHCVASYSRSCQERNCSIWSMTVEDESGICRRKQTIEVSRHRAIVQCRGVRNKLPGDQELRVLEKWAEFAKLQIGRLG